MTEKAPLPDIKVGDRVRVVHTDSAELTANVSQVATYGFRVDLRMFGLHGGWFSYSDPGIVSVEVIEPALPESALLPEWVTKPRQWAIGSYAGWPAIAIRDDESWSITWIDDDFDRQDVWVSDADFFALGFTPTDESEGAPES